MGLYFGPEAREWAFKNFRRVHFIANQDKQELVESPRDWKISPKFREINPKFFTITMRYSFSVKVMGGYILAQKLEIERSKSFAVSILLQTKAIRN